MHKNLKVFLKKRQQDQNGITCAKPHVTKLRLNTEFNYTSHTSPRMDP